MLRCAAPLFRKNFVRAYATEAPAAADGTFKLTFALPHKALYNKANVQQVNLPATSGDMGILAHHVPTIQQLKPGVIEVIAENNNKKKFFVSGGFAVMNPDSTLNINAVEGAALDELDLEVAKRNLDLAKTQAVNANDEEMKTIAKIESEVYEALVDALSKP